MNKFLLLLMICLFFLIFSNQGTIKYIKLKKKNIKLSQEIESLDKKSKLLMQEKEKLKNDMEYIEQIAREKHGMAKKGEKIFLIKKGKKGDK